MKATKPPSTYKMYFRTAQKYYYLYERNRQTTKKLHQELTPFFIT